MKELGNGNDHLNEFADPDSDRHAAMVDRISHRLGLTSLRYQRLPDLVQAIGLPREKVCTYCWDGAESCGTCPKSRTTQEEESVPAQPK